MQDKTQLFDGVAFVKYVPEYGLARGQMETVVEKLSTEAVFVNFSDDQGKIYAMHPLLLNPN